MKITHSCLLFLAAILLSCDPVYEQQIILSNNSTKDLNFKALVNISDTSFLSSMWSHDMSVIESIDSTKTLFKLIISPGEQLDIINNGGIGYTDFNNTPSAKKYLKSFYDTLYLDSPKAKINVFDFDIWSQKYNNGRYSTFANFTLSLTDKDLE